MRLPQTFIHLSGQCFATAVCLLALVVNGPAQSSRAHEDKQLAQRADASSDGAAHVRFWRGELRGFSNLRVTLTPVGSTSKQHNIARDLGGGSGYSFNNYLDLPAGRGMLEVFGSSATRPLTSLSVDLAPDSFNTVLLTEAANAGDSPRLEVVVDRAAGVKKEAEKSQITVRSFVAGVKDLHITVGDKLNAQFADEGGYLQMRGLQPALYPVRTTGTSADGKPFEWNNDADLKQHPRQTLLVYPDPYGRIRPRLIVDGESQPEPSADKSDQR